MPLERIALLASIISCVAVVTGVVYAALQVRHNTRAVTASALQQVMASFAAISSDIAKDASIADIYIRGANALPSLSDVERVRYTMMLLSFLRRAENVFFQANMQVLSRDHWSGIRNSIKDVMATPGARTCWVGIEDRLSPDFADFINSLLNADSPKIEQNRL